MPWGQEAPCRKAPKNHWGGINGSNGSTGQGSGAGTASGSDADRKGTATDSNADQKGTATDSNADGDEQADTTVITSFEELNRSVYHQEIPKGAKETDIYLPKTLLASGFVVTAATPSDAMLDPDYIPDEGEVTVKDSLTIEDVDWELTGKNGSPTSYEEGREKNCAYYYRPVLPEGYEVVRDVNLPEIEVWYGFGNRNASDFEGSGTEADPWKIKDYKDLKKLAQNVGAGESYQGKHFKLVENFSDVSGEVEEPIGDTRAFQGTFDGGGETVKLKIIDSSIYRSGLFRTVGSDGTVKNVIVSGTVTHDGSGGECVGGVAGYNGGTIVNCGSTCTVIIMDSFALMYAGGVAGENGLSGIIKNCWNSGDVQGKMAGGLAGRNGGGIENCWNSGRVQGKENAGGVAGYSRSTLSIMTCYNIGEVIAGQEFEWAGGIAGEPNGSISNCVSLGATVISSADNSGRILPPGSATLTGNKARADMLIGDVDSLAIPSDAGTMTVTGINGENVEVGVDSLADVFSQFPSEVWEIPNRDQKLEVGCELPALKGDTDNPAVQPTARPTLPSPITPPSQIVLTFDGGGIFANGAALILKEGKTNGEPDHTKTVIYMDKNRNKQIDGNESPWDPDGDTGMEYNGTEAGNDLSGMYIYGGKKRESLEGYTQITMLGGNVFSIRGGGLFASLTGDTDITIKGGSVFNCYGGGAAGDVNGSTRIEISGGSVTSCYGGGYASSGEAANVIGDTSVLMSGGKAGIIYGGGHANKGNASVGKSSSVILSDSAKADVIYGGGSREANSDNADVTGAVSVELKDSASAGKVYLGGAFSGSATTPPSIGIGSVLTVGGKVSVGAAGADGGICLNGGTGTSAVTNGVDSFTIGVDLAGAEYVYVAVPKGFDISGNPVIATGAVPKDLRYIKLIGDGAEGLETYWENGAIKLRQGFAGRGTAENPWLIEDYNDLAAMAEKMNGGKTYKGDYFKLDDSFNTEADVVRTSIGTYQNRFDGVFDGNGRTVRLEINKPGVAYQGLFGCVDTNGIIRNVIVFGEVTGGNDTGGVAGQLRGTAENCGSAAMVTGVTNTGGVVGYFAGKGVKNCYSTGAVNGESQVGGIVGIVKPGTVEYCYNVGDVKANGQNVGGICGTGDSEGKVENCVSLGLTVTGGSADSTGRITGVTFGTFDGNKARSDMKIGVESSLGIPGSGIGADQMNGANIDADGTVPLTDVFTDGDWINSGIWNIPGGSQKLKAGCELPTLVTCRGAQTPRLPGTATQPVPTLEGDAIFANGAALILKAGQTLGQQDDTKTVIYVDENRDGVVNGTDWIWDPDGATGIKYNGTDEGNNLGGRNIYGGSHNASIPGGTKITMTGGTVAKLYGGGLADTAGANVGGDTDITVSRGSVLILYGGGRSKGNSLSANIEGGTLVKVTSSASVAKLYGGGFAGAESAQASVARTSAVEIAGQASVTFVYGGGYAYRANSNVQVQRSAAVSVKDQAQVINLYLGGEADPDAVGSNIEVGQGSTLTVGAGVQIGRVNEGIRLNGGTGTSAVTNGVNSFAIDPNLTGTEYVYVVVPGGFDASANPVIATGAVQADLNHIRLTGAGAEGLAFRLDGDSIRIGEAQAYSVTVDGNGGTGSAGGGRYAPGQSVTIQAGTRSGHRFNGWTVVAGAPRLTDSTKANTTFIMPAGDVTVRAEWVKNDSSGGDDNGDHGNDGGGGTTGGGTTGGGSTGGGTTGGATSGTGEGGTATTTPPTTTQTGDGGSVSTTTTTNPATGTTVTTEVKKDAAGNVISAEAKVQTTQYAVTTGENGTTIVVRVDGAAVNAAAQAARSAQGADGRQVQVDVELPADAMTTQLRTADGRPLAVEVEIHSDLAGTTGGPGTSGGAAAQVTGIRLQKEVIEAAKAAGKDVTVTVRDERGNVYYQWIFTADDMRNSGIPAADVNLSVRIIPVKRLTGEQQSIKDAVAAGSGTSGAEAPGLYIGFDHNGILPATAQVRIPAGNDAGIRPGDTVWLCWRDPATGQLVNAPENQYTVDENGFVTVRLDRAYEYVLVPVPAAGAAQPPRPSGHAVHVIQKGDTLNKLAGRYGCTVADLLAANQIANVYDLRIGQEIMIP